MHKKARRGKEQKVIGNTKKVPKRKARENQTRKQEKGEVGGCLECTAFKGSHSSCPCHGDHHHHITTLLLHLQIQCLSFFFYPLSDLPASTVLLPVDHLAQLP